jgi:hypothetical protein
MMPTPTHAEFETLAAQTGLPLSRAQKDTLFSVYPTLLEIIACAAAPMPREAEPSLIFTPEIGS